MKWGLSRWGTRLWGAGGADTIVDFFDQAPWETYGESEVQLPFGPGGDLIDVPIELSRRVFYRLEVTDETGEKLAEITDWLSGEYSASIGEPTNLDVTLHGDDASIALLVHPNRIVLRDARGFVLDRYLPRRIRKWREGDARFVRVQGQSVLVLLARQPVLAYSATATVSEHVAALMAMQEGDFQIEVGAIDEPIASTSVTLDVEATTVLSALHTLRELLDIDSRGHLYVDRENQLRWVVRTGPADRKLVIGWNLTGIEYSTNDDDLITRLYMYGEGQDGEHRVNLVDAGLANPYIEQNVDLYGVVPYVKVDRRILRPETLLEHATAIISEFSTPRIEITVDVLDLARADTPGLDLSAFGDYWVASEYDVIDPDQGITARVRVARISQDLTDPLRVRMDLSNRTRSIADLLRGLDSRSAGPTNVNVGNGDAYRNISRQYDSDPGVDGHAYRDGDWKHVPDEPDGHMEFYDQDAFKPIVVLSDLDPQPIGSVADPGESTEAARIDHVHTGSLTVIAADYAALVLLTPADGTVGYIQDKDWHYLRQNALWRKSGPFNVADAAALAALTNANCGMVDGDTAYQEDIDRYYDRQNGAWVLRMGAKTETTFPAIPTVPTMIQLGGQLWYADAASTVWRAMVMGTTKTGVVGST